MKSNNLIGQAQSLALMLMIALVAMCSTANGQRIVSLMPSATETMIQMGADATIVGRTSYCPKAQDGTKTTIVGDAMTVNVEMIAALHPDVVIASTFTSKGTCEQIEKLGIKLVTLATPKDFDEICAQTTILGITTRHEQEAKALIECERHKVDSLSSVLKTRKIKAYIQVGANPVFGATPDYYIEDILKRLNLKNVIGVGKGGSTREAVVALRPELIVVSTMGGLGKDEAQKWHQTTRATILIIDENTLSCPSPSTFRIAMERIGKAAIQAAEYKRQAEYEYDSHTGATAR